MLIIGLLLLAATGAFIGLAIAYNLSGGPEYTVAIFDESVVTLNSLAIFCTGLALAFLFCLGLFLARSGAVHRRHPHEPQMYGTGDTTTLHDGGGGPGDSGSPGGDHGR
ncbi:hypothetical protein ACFS5L_22130 [Streptomyces phyllanthi]|uniref:hypothetical protein n=1 Tax=Streptomyces phyllanthi TaxID=1803180 RepID=UPI001D14A19B|nr:hypothetical protein [Streptomyces phyllanthi]